MIRLALVVLAILTFVPQPASAMRDYWQQRVEYKIDVTLIDSIHSLDGKLSVRYFNNSPDTLREVYFHLYYLAFQPGSMMQVRGDAINSGSISQKILALKPEEQGRYRIDQITTEAGNASHEITGTVMKVSLPQPLLPNSSTTISFTYFEQIPRQTRRGGWMSSEGVKYSMAQWYPKIAEYDERGWNANEYIAREFYGVWGDFDVSITLPSSFTVAASGQVQNPQEVGHGYEKIAAGEKSGQAMPEEKTGMTTWKWRAENVHDFAWVADDTYIHDWATIRDSVTIHAIYKTSVMSMWKNTLKYTEFMINTMSDLYFPYPYRNFYNTHAGDGGMEYPQLVQNTGFRNELSMAGITAHEGAHQWFYGILGNNEIREAYLDEGFTSYATTQIMVKQFGNEQQYPGTERSWLDWFIPKPNNKGDNYRGYLSLAASGYEEPLTIPHDWFREDVGAGEVYGKTQAILSMLEYTLGESTFDRGMKEYFNRWKFKHPSLDDFQRVMEDVSKTDLDWFFDQWFRTERTVDYALRDVDSDEENGKYRTKVKLRRLGQAVMPIDLHFTYKDGSTGQATIPLAVHQGTGYQKPESQMFFPPWDWVSPGYEASILTPKEVETTEIDTSWRLQDLNRMNNRYGYTPIYGFIPAYGPDPHDYVAMWKQLNINPPLDGAYYILRPILMPILPFLNPLSDKAGFIAGMGVKVGSYLHGEGDMKMWIRYSDGLDASPEIAPEFRGRGSAPLRWLGRLTTLDHFIGILNGLASTRFTLEKNLRPTYYLVGSTHKLRGYIESHAVIRDDPRAPFDESDHGYYKLLPQIDLPWQELNTRIVGVGYHFTSEGKSFDLDLFGESTFWGSSRSYGRTRLTMSKSFDLFGISSALRLNAGFSKGPVPYERRFFAKTADIATHQFSDTYQAYRWWSNGEAMLRGGAGLMGQIDLREFDKRTQNTVGGQMMGLNLDVDGFKVPYVPQIRVGFHVGAAWIADAKPKSMEEIWDRTQFGGGISLNLDLKSLFPWQLQGVVDQYAPTPGFSAVSGEDFFSGTSF